MRPSRWIIRDQAWFLNQVVEAETALFPMQLLTRIGRIERELGRVRTVRKRPRTIDIDILLYGAAVVQTARLEIPHPRMAERRFVLAPLAELAPDLRHPVTPSQPCARCWKMRRPRWSACYTRSSIQWKTFTQP